eukprot:1159623-Pelagomonas_calceolata.AAC.6
MCFWVRRHWRARAWWFAISQECGKVAEAAEKGDARRVAVGRRPTLAGPIRQTAGPSTVTLLLGRCGMRQTSAKSKPPTVGTRQWMGKGSAWRWAVVMCSKQEESEVVGGSGDDDKAAGVVQ